MGDNLTNDCEFWLLFRRAALMVAHALADRGCPALLIILTGKTKAE